MASTCTGIMRLADGDGAAPFQAASDFPLPHHPLPPSLSRAMRHADGKTADVAASIDAPKAVSAPRGMEGSLGILYACGEQTGGEIAVADALRGRKVRGMCGAYDQFVVLADAWELEWALSTGGDNLKMSELENRQVAEGLQDVKIHHIAVGENHRVALSLDGQLFSWGRSGAALTNGELGHLNGSTSRVLRAAIPAAPESDSTEKRPPSPVNSAQSLNTTPVNTPSAIGVPHRVLTSPELFFSQVACGKHHSVAITDNGDIYAWGRNFEGQLGHAFTTLPKKLNAVLNGICAWPKYVSSFLGKPRAVSVCCGDTFTIVLLSDGSVYRLGDRSSGVAPPRLTVDSPSTSPDVDNTCTSVLNLMLTRGSGGEPFVGIACGYAHVLAVTSVGEAFSWGLNTFGQLGHGRKPEAGDVKVKGDMAVPKVVQCDNTVKWAKVFAGGNYSAALTTDHQLYTWGNSHYGKLGHGKGAATAAGPSPLPNKYASEFAPRRVEYFQHTNISSVVCGARNLFAFAPTYVSSLAPLCGELSGGYELRLRGSGFWATDDLTVRFVPLIDGHLVRGSLGTFCEATGEIVCQVPKFRLPGEFAVEVSMNGKHFTSNGRTFTVFKRPQVAAVSISDARFSGGEEIALTLSGNLPELCQHPILRFVCCRVDAESGEVVSVETQDRGAPVVTGIFDECPESDDGDEETKRDTSSLTGRMLRLKTPAVAVTEDEIVPYTLEISYDDGLRFSPVCVDPTLMKLLLAKDGEIGEASDEEESSLERRSYPHKHPQPESPRPALPHVIWMHEARLVRVRPNSFLMNALPQTIELELHHLLPPEVISLSVSIVHHLRNGDSTEITPELVLSVSTDLHIENINGDIVTCTIPPLLQWEPPTASGLQTPPNEWWKSYAKTGFTSQIRVSMNGGRSFLPAQPQNGNADASIAAQVYAMPAPGRLLSLFPDMGLVSGGTQVAVAGEAFYFDTQDAAVSLQWRESRMTVPAACLRPDASVIPTAAEDSIDRRVVFRTPPLPFLNDTSTAAAMAEGMVLGTREEVEVFVALDGVHFADVGLRFVYCAVPEVKSITPSEAEPGTKMVLAVDKVAATPAACVRLTAAESQVSLVVPVEIVEASHTASFVLPELPLGSDQQVHVVLSLNGQELMEGLSDVTAAASPAGVSFCYKLPSAKGVD
ncbi:hypothetical protein BBJ28_00017209 [Nothophytophthora sp. Chile5]|nr:hypothetical protein BBJ28_00017209 [Nothophytophthora sp. Chile5]